MNVYDEAHGLVRAIKENQEFKHYSELREKVEANESVNEMLKNFQQKQMELQAKAMMGEELGEEFQTTLQNLYGIYASEAASREKRPPRAAQTSSARETAATVPETTI